MSKANTAKVIEFKPAENKKQEYVEKGERAEVDIVFLLTVRQRLLFNYIVSWINDPDHTTVVKGGYVLYDPHPTIDQKPLICVHLDTVDNVKPFKSEIVDNNGVISLSGAGKKALKCLGADDRAGVWIALEMIRQGTATPFAYAFFCDEESGCIGARKFIEGEDYGCFIGIDRKCNGQPEFATYGCDNDDLTKLVKEQYCDNETFGSFTDCSELGEKFEKACLNITAGYRNEHTKQEILYKNIMSNTLKTLLEINIPCREYKAEMVHRWSIMYGDSAADNDFDYAAFYRGLQEERAGKFGTGTGNLNSVPDLNEGEDVDDVLLPHSITKVSCDYCNDHLRLYETPLGDKLCYQCLKISGYAYDC